MASCDAASQADQLPPPPPHSAAIVSDAGEPTSASQVDPEAQLPPPTDDPPASFMEKVVLHLSPLAAIFSDTGEPIPASQVDPEAQLPPPPPPPPPTDDPPASFLEKVVQVVLQLMAVFTGGPTTRNHGHELAFKLYHLAVVTIYGFDIILVICLIARFAGIDRPWVRKYVEPISL